MHFASTEISYFSPEQDPSPILHYWSLAVEEQFYFIWPILFVILSKFSSIFRRVMYVFLIFGFLVLSFTWAYSSTTARYVFFSLPSRAWELLLGAFVAEIEDDVDLTHLKHYLNLFGVLITSVVGDSSYFTLPGFLTIIPCLGTACILIVSDSDSFISKLLTSSSLRWLGKASYSMYLWHWPPIILVSIYMYGTPFKPTIISCLIAYLISIPFVLFSVNYIEHELRVSKFFQTTFRGLLIGSLLLVSPLVLIHGILPSKIEDSSYEASNIIPIVTTNYTFDLFNSTNSLLARDILFAKEQINSLRAIFKNQLKQPKIAPNNLIPSLDLTIGNGQGSAYEFESVFSIRVLGEFSWHVYHFGDLLSNRTIMFIGDSHAVNAMESWFKVLKDTHFKGYLFFLSSCTPFSMCVLPHEKPLCEKYQKVVVEEILNVKPYMVVVRYLFGVDELHTPFEVDGFEKTERQMRQWFAKMTSLNIRFLLMSPNPRATSKKYLYTTRECIAAHVLDYSSCEYTSDHATFPLWHSMNRRVAGEFNIPYLDTTDLYCVEEGCPVIVGNILTIFDNTHISAKFNYFLAPYMQSMLVLTNFSTFENPFLRFKN